MPLLFHNTLCLVRGGGDLATGVVHRLHHAGFPVIVLELDQPRVVRRMVSAMLKGLADTIADPNAAFEISKKYVDGLAAADEAVQKEVLARSIELWKAERLGFSDLRAWQNMQDTLLQMGLLTKPLDVSKAFTNEFVP